MSASSNGNAMGGLEGIHGDTTLISTAANDLLSPLILVRQLGLLIESDVLDDEKKKLLTTRLTLTSERALRIATSLALISQDQQKFAFEPINPMSICQDVVQELSPLYSAHGQRIALPRRIRTPLLVGNQRLLHHILLTFLDNALNYGSQGKPVQIGIRTHKDKVRIGVRDFGPALPIDLWTNIGKNIGNNKVSFSNRPHVSVISLVTAKKLADAMGSAVGIVRHRNGTTFYIDLTISQQMSLL